ncbi:MAG: tetratricopeptide (TPR) repeat protein [Flavobacteriales bacterium]|jgi:tetratricopeptide (TPR) repeat protein
MRKTIITLSAVALTTFTFGQKLQLTEAAVAYQDVSPMWFAMPDQYESTGLTLKGAKKAIDEAWSLQEEKGSLTKSKDLAKLNYYRGAIYLDYMMLMGMDSTNQKELTDNEEMYRKASMGSLKKSLSISDYYQEDIEGKMNFLRATSLNGGVKMFEEAKYEEAFGAFAGAVEFSDVMGLVDTLAMFNAGLAADNNEDYDNAIKYYYMAAQNNYTNSASPYQSLLRVVDKKNDGPSEETLKYLQEAKAKYPNDIGLSIEEFNYYNSKGEAAKAQASLEKAIAQDPKNPIYQYSIGTTFDQMANDLADEGKYVEAQVYIDKAKESYQAAIDLDPNFSDAYYNMGVLYNNESYNISEKIKTIQDMKLEQAEGERAKELLRSAIPFLTKAHELNPSDANPLKLLKTIYFTLELNDEYTVVADKLKALGQ